MCLEINWKKVEFSKINRMNNKIRLGILGGGGDSLIGVLHRVASSMFDRYEIVGGVFNPNYPDNVAFAKKIGLKES